ncbi:MAG TPA: Wzz/FepE/Etk N-terminal domain-containing protein [Flavisolibacter sp.]|nr:Wzz/FepE/Etk N-terminal domain-containing protein [Flavisolibacter sp.]
MDFVYLFRVLRKRKWIIIGSAALAALIAWYFTRNEPKIYRSSTRISTGYGVPDNISINENENFNLFNAEIKFNNAINTWTSPSVISLLSYELILHDLKSNKPFRRLKADQLQSPVYKSINKAQAIKVFEEKLATMSVLTSYKPEEKKLLEFLNLYGYGYKNLIQNLSIYWVQRTDYVQVDGVTENPELSAFLCNSAFQQFIRYYGRIRSAGNQETVDTLASLVEKKRQELEEKNRMLRGEKPTDISTEGTMSTFELISELEKSITVEKNIQVDYYSSLRKINQRLSALGGSANTGGAVNNEELVLARQAMNEAYSEYLKSGDPAKLTRYNQLRSEYNTKYASTRSTTGSTPGTENRSELLQKKNDLEVDIEASNSKIRSIEQKIAALKSNASSTLSKGANVETLMEEVKLAEREYLEAKQKYNNAYEMSSASVNNFRQLQLAQPAIEPEPSKRKLIIGMAGTVTLISAILIIMLLVYLDSSIKTPAVFGKVVSLKLISMVNFMNLKNKNLKEILASNNSKESRLEKQRSNIFRESIRKLRYEIEWTGKKIFLFTSTQKGQGKTTLIQALSYSMSLSNKKILVIDTNFCNNDLTVQMDADPVLEKLSSEDIGGTLVERVKKLAKDIGVGNNVFVIGSEGGDYTPSEILPRDNFLHHLHALTSEFDYIFLEGPPLNNFSDSKELTQYVDGVVAVFSATHIVKQIDKESISFFKELNGKFCGSVLNKVNLENVNAT